MAEHIYAGGCPDETQPDARDANCPACELIVETGRLQRVIDKAYDVAVEFEQDPAIALRCVCEILEPYVDASGSKQQPEEG